MQELVSVREFARRVGCSDVAVHKAIKAQKIVKGFIVGPDGKGKIDPAIAAKEWGKNFDPSYTSNPKLRETIGAETESVSDSAGSPKSSTSIAEAKRAQAILRAKLLEVELREKQGQLVDKQQVYNALFSFGQEVRSSILTVPDRVIDEVIACKSRNEAHTLLYSALVEALETIANMEGKNIIK